MPSTATKKIEYILENLLECMILAIHYFSKKLRYRFLTDS